MKPETLTVLRLRLEIVEDQIAKILETIRDEEKGEPAK